MEESKINPKEYNVAEYADIDECGWPINIRIVRPDGKSFWYNQGYKQEVNDVGDRNNVNEDYKTMLEYARGEWADASKEVSELKYEKAELKERIARLELVDSQLAFALSKMAENL